MNTQQDAINRLPLAVSFEEAATMIGVSKDHFERHVAPDLKVIRSGRRKLVAVDELKRWVAENQTRALEP
jgi:hypothetical protein